MLSTFSKEAALLRGTIGGNSRVRVNFFDLLFTLKAQNSIDEIYKGIRRASKKSAKRKI